MSRKNVLGKRLGVSIVIRVILATVLLGSAAIAYFVNGSTEETLYLTAVVSAVYFLTLTYLIVEPLFDDFTRIFKWIQIVCDLVLVSAVVLVTGGRSSPFIVFYALIIIFASLSLSKTSSYITAALSGVCYLLILIYTYNPEYSSGLTGFFLDALTWGGERGFAYTYFNLSAFLFVAVLSGYLSDRFKQLGESSERLRFLENLHENILQNLTSGVITLDLQGKVISVNRTGLEILGIRGKDRVVGRELGSLMSGLGLENLADRKREQMIYSAPDGRRLSLGFSSSTLKDGEEREQGYIIVFQDLTEINRLEQRLRVSEKMALLGQLAAGLAHELRNPLSAISGAVEVISGELNLTEENLRLIRVANQEVERLNMLVEDFLLLTVPIERLTTSVDIGSVIGETVKTFTRTVRRGGIEIATDIERGVFVQADSYRIKQVIWNLLFNSVEAMPEGGKIKVQCRSNGDGVFVKISDSGSGIEDKIVPRIFEPFFTTKEVGTGLGLAIVQKVVEGYKGKINVMSSKGVGTEVVINLPRTERKREEIGHRASTEV